MKPPSCAAAGANQCRSVGYVKEKRVVITGAGRGLGKVLAMAFDQGGARLGIAGRSKDDLDEVATSLGRTPVVCAGDIRDQEFNERLADEMVTTFGGLDVWISNAGISPEVVHAALMELESWRQIIDTNLTGVFLGARAAARVMESGGRIIVTGSVLGERPRGGLSAYSASKGGAEALVRALAQELGPKQITVNLVAPGWFDSGMGANWRRNPDRHRAIADHTALGRWGTATDLPGAYLFLASDAAAYITGTTITVDGGYALV